MQDFQIMNGANGVIVNLFDDYLTVTNFDKEPYFLKDSASKLSLNHYDKLKSYKSVSALLKYAKAHALPSPNTATLLCEPVAVEGNPSPVALAPTTGDTPIPCTPTALCDECFDTPQEGETLCNACKQRKISSQEMPLDTSLVFKLHSDEFGVTLRHDYSSDYMTITKIKNLRPVYEVGLWYSEGILSLLLASRNAQTLFTLAECLENRHGLHNDLPEPA